MKTKKILSLWLPVVIWCGLIFFLSNQPNLKTDLKEDFILRKIAHVLEYAILTFLFFRAFQKKNLKYLVLSGILSVLYAASDEYHQTFIQGRSGNFFDLGIDSLGMLFAFLYLLKKQILSKKN